MTKRWEEIDSSGCKAKFVPGERVLVLPTKTGAIVIEQMKSYDYPEYFWGNVRVRYDDGVEGTSNSWQLKKL